jgi:hypothetical protein
MKIPKRLPVHINFQFNGSMTIFPAEALLALRLGDGYPQSTKLWHLKEQCVSFNHTGAIMNDFAHISLF